MTTDTEPAFIEINDGHLHELMDRAFLMCQMFDTALLGHPAASLFTVQLDAVGAILAALYQDIAKVAMAEARAA